MFCGVFEMDNKYVCEVMVLWIDVFMIDVEIELEEFCDVLLSENFLRVFVFIGD